MFLHLIQFPELYDYNAQKHHNRDNNELTTFVRGISGWSDREIQLHGFDLVNKGMIQQVGKISEHLTPLETFFLNLKTTVLPKGTGLLEHIRNPLPEEPNI